MRNIKLRIKILKNIALVLLALFLLHWNADAVNNSSITIAIATNTSFNETFDAWKDIYFSLIEIIASLIFIILLLFKLHSWTRSDKGLLILPFDVAKNEDKCDFSGKALSHLFIAELQRIKQINSAQYEGIESEKVKISSVAPTGEDAAIPQLGTVGAGSTSISIGELLATIKRLISRNPEIACSLQKYDSVVSLTACLQKTPRKLQESAPTSNTNDPELVRGYVWEVHDNIGDESIPELVKDLSFKIAYHLSGSISAKTWVGFKHYTEALSSYGQYKLTNERDTGLLDNAKWNCIKAINVEKDYKKLFDLLSNIGIAYSNKSIYNKAEEDS